MKATAIIFDITGVLFKENKLKIIRKIGIKRIIRYIARHRVNPLTTCLNTLQAMYEREKPSDTPPIIFKKRPMPQCAADWQRGFTDNTHVTQELEKHLQTLTQEGYFASAQEERLVKDILRTTLDADYLMAISKPIKRTINIVKKIRKKGGYKIFILSNMGHEPFELLKKKYPDILALFDDCIISADTHYIKPEPMIFNHLLNKHQLKADDCIFIDDQEENIIAAQELGITGILFDKAPHVRKKLKQLGIL
jgi:HAD superfamily hydrolase (TIGR01509 family)